MEVSQMVILFNNEVYFKCYEHYKANCAFLLTHVTREEGTLK